MIRRVIHIDQDKCNGCGLCVNACHEGAIGLVNGKAQLMRDEYCDGLGDCLPECPTGAISFVEREAADYDEAAVAAHLAARQSERANQAASVSIGGGCPGSRMQVIHHGGCPGSAPQTLTADKPSASITNDTDKRPSEISSWPLEIKLIPTHAPYFYEADLLIAADCTAFAYGDFHRDFMKGKTTIIGCPKLDGVDYSEKLSIIMAENAIKSVTVCRMEVPCCGGLENAARRALAASGKDIPFIVVTFSLQGDIL